MAEMPRCRLRGCRATYAAAVIDVAKESAAPTLGTCELGQTLAAVCATIARWETTKRCNHSGRNARAPVCCSQLPTVTLRSSFLSKPLSYHGTGIFKCSAKPISHEVRELSRAFVLRERQWKHKQSGAVSQQGIHGWGCHDNSKSKHKLMNHDPQSALTVPVAAISELSTTDSPRTASMTKSECFCV